MSTFCTQSSDRVTPVPLRWQEIAARLNQTEQWLAELSKIDKQGIHPVDTAKPAAAGPALTAQSLVSIVIPVFNESQTITTVLRRVSQLPFAKEILVVDDCSTDGTRDLLNQLRDIPGLQILLHEKNSGKGAALRTGFSQVRGDIVVVQDADLEYDPQDIPAVIGPILRGEAEAVFGSRFLGQIPQDKSLVHRLGNWMLTEASNLFTGVRLTDMETCYKAFRSTALRDIRIKQNRFGVEPELTAKLVRRGYRIQEVPIRYHARSYQEGKKIGVRDLFKAIYCIVRYGICD